MIIILMAKLNSLSLHRDLGLLTSDVLSWNLHIANITAKANSILGLIKRTCRDVNDVTTLKTLYCSLVRPIGLNVPLRCGILIQRVTLVV